MSTENSTGADVLVPGTFSALTLTERAKAAETAILLREIITELNTDQKLQKGVVFHTYEGSMTDLLKEHGYVSHIGDIIALLQETGIAHIIKKNGQKTLWQICDITFLDGFLSAEYADELVSTAIAKVKRWRNVIAESRNMRKKLAEMSAPLETPDIPGPNVQELLDESAKTLAALQTTQEENAALKKETARLREELAVRPRDVVGALASAIREIREGRKE